MTNTTTRTSGLKQMLTNQRRQIQVKVEERIRDGRADRSNEVHDIVDLCDLAIEEALSFALLQMRTEALARVEAALTRLDTGMYGACFECGSAIAKSRLRALPFAVRCKNCEERLEQEQSRWQKGQRPGSVPLFPEFRVPERG